MSWGGFFLGEMAEGDADCVGSEVGNKGRVDGEGGGLDRTVHFEVVCEGAPRVSLLLASRVPSGEG